MKDKVIIFIIGALVGAVIASGAFLVYTKINNATNTNQNSSENAPSNMQGNMGTPPEKPDGDNNEPPAKPGENAQSDESTNNSNN